MLIYAINSKLIQEHYPNYLLIISFYKLMHANLFFPKLISTADMKERNTLRFKTLQRYKNHPPKSLVYNYFSVEKNIALFVRHPLDAWSQVKTTKIKEQNHPFKKLLKGDFISFPILILTALFFATQEKKNHLSC